MIGAAVDSELAAVAEAAPPRMIATPN